MKRLLLIFFLPAIISSFVIYYFASESNLNNILYPKKETSNLSKDAAFIENFADFPGTEDQFLQDNQSPTIFLLGSSELTGETEASPYRFIPEHCSTKLKAIGHAGNQCFSIYSQLLANEDRLNGARLVIIVSPMWFFSKEAAGTSSKIFLEYNSERFLNRINENDSASEFRMYENERISHMFSDFSSPGFAIKQMHFGHQASKSSLHYLLYKPIICTDELLLKTKFQITGDQRNYSPLKRMPLISDSLLINWDSLFTSSKNEILKTMTNNSWGIGDDYYTEHIKGKSSKIKVGPTKENYELQDFKMLVKLLRNKKANASFIIIPMNPYYYTNLEEATPILTTLENEIKHSGFPCYNFWVTEPAKYEHGILKDIMHLSKYGWYKADKFIIETYHLIK
jgi:poly-D-alanine transfer protein DltD